MENFSRTTFSSAGQGEPRRSPAQEAGPKHGSLSLSLSLSLSRSSFLPAHVIPEGADLSLSLSLALSLSLSLSLSLCLSLSFFLSF